MDPLIGRTLDERYVVRSRIARGGMATVYLGNDLRLQRRVAIKIMHQHLVDDENFTRRFEQEARSAAMLGNTNVVGVFDQGVDAGMPYLVMEYLPGITLRELLKQQRLLSADQALEIGEAVLAGLAAAHDAGIVHRDVKPENVLLADDGRIKIGDFGLARAVSANTTTGQALLGTIAYLSPELVTRGIADARSDVYAFGIMFFELLTGQQPFKGEQAMQIAYQHAHSEVPVPSTLNPEVSPELDDLVRWCTQRDPDARPHSAREALDSLRAIRNGGALSTTRVLHAPGPAGATPSTTVLSSVDQQFLAAGAAVGAGAGAAGAAAASAVTAGHGVRSRAGASEAQGALPPASAVERAEDAGARRGVRGRWVAALLTLALALSAGAGWWWGQGPGSQVSIPATTGLDRESATAALVDLTLTVATAKCPSLEVTKGLVVESRPAAGTRVDRDSEVVLCLSTGPRMLPVPELDGLTVEAARAEIEAAGFAYGEVLQQRFDQGARDTVFRAVDPDGKKLGETYPEQSTISLYVSAGPMPTVPAGSSVKEATKILEDAGLTVDRSMNTKSYHDTIAKGAVIGVVTSGKAVKVGSSVGLNVSRGPELVEIPDVKDMRLGDAMQALRDLGFTPTTFLPEALWGLAEADGTNPKAGERVPKGAEIRVKASL